MAGSRGSVHAMQMVEEDELSQQNLRSSSSYIFQPTSLNKLSSQVNPAVTIPMHNSREEYARFAQFEEQQRMMQFGRREHSQEQPRHSSITQFIEAVRSEALKAQC